MYPVTWAMDEYCKTWSCDFATMLGVASKYRPLNPLFMQHQAASNPQIRNLWSKGPTWGFMHVSTDGDKLTVRMLTTPSDFSGRPILEGEFSFPHRSAEARR